MAMGQNVDGVNMRTEPLLAPALAPTISYEAEVTDRRGGSVRFRSGGVATEDEKSKREQRAASAMREPRRGAPSALAASPGGAGGSASVAKGDVLHQA